MNRSRYAAGAVQPSMADTSDRRLVNRRRGAGGLLTAPDIALWVPEASRTTADLPLRS